ncbi:MAG: K+/H+ antiporter subunit F [Rhodobacteraceae bacterium]|nr:K+/H+ antiporter subunit F [Paracoccaceae bacterium]
MIAIAIQFASACFGIGLLLNLWVMARTGTPGDKVLALDTMVINAIALMVLYGLSHGTAVYFEAVIIIAMFGFVSTVAYARFKLRGNIIE